MNGILSLFGRQTLSLAAGRLGDVFSGFLSVRKTVSDSFAKAKKFNDAKIAFVRNLLMLESQF